MDHGQFQTKQHETKVHVPSGSAVNLMQLKRLSFSRLFNSPKPLESVCVSLGC